MLVWPCQYINSDDSKKELLDLQHRQNHTHNYTCYQTQILIMVQKTLHTQRLELHPLSEDHEAALYDLDKNAEVMRYIFSGKALSKEESKMVLDHLLQIAKTDDRFGCWVGYSGDEFVGWWVLAPSENKSEGQDTEATPTPNDKRVEIGMRVAPKVWGQGYAKEGLEAMLRYCVEDVGAEEVYGETMAVNTGSRKAMAKCGLRHVRTWHNKYEDFTPAPGIEEGEVEYRITREEWLLQKSTSCT